MSDAEKFGLVGWTIRTSNIILEDNIAIGGVSPVPGSRICLPFENDAVTPTIVFTDGSDYSGIYFPDKNNMYVSLDGVAAHLLTTAAIQSINSQGYYLLKTGGYSTTVPKHSFVSDTDTGLGIQAADAMNAIVGGDELTRWTQNDAADNQIRFNGNVGIDLDPTVNMLGLSIEKGLLALKETTEPTADTNYGKIWTESDNRMYFQDGAGVKHELMVSGENLGAMSIHENAVELTVSTANTPIAVRLFSTGEVSNFTFDAGLTGAITAFADGGSGQVTVTSVAHGLSNGAYVSIQGTTNYNSVFLVANKDDDTYEITHSWDGDDAAGSWDQGSGLTAGTGAAGKYDVTYNISGNSVTANKTFEWHVFINGTEIIGSHVQQRFSSNAIKSFSAGDIINIAEGDVVCLYIEGNTDTTNFVHTSVNVRLRRL